jgi:hypothetical protein
MNIIKIQYDIDGSEQSRTIQTIDVFRVEPTNKTLENKNGSPVQCNLRLFCRPNFVFDFSPRILYKIDYRFVEKDLISVLEQYDINNVLNHYEVYI